MRFAARSAPAAALLLSALFALGACSPDKDSKEQAVKPMAVEIDEVTTQRFVQTLEFPGVAQPIEERMVSAEAGGRVLKAPAEEGERVEKGDLLLQIDAQNTTAQINLLSSQVASTRREYDRTTRLAAEGLATPQQLDQLESQLEQSQLALKQAKVGRGLSTVKSPFSGVVAEKMIEQGEYAAPGQPIVRLIDASTIKLEITVPESMIRFIKIGDEVDVHFSALDRQVTGKVIKRGVVVLQPTQTFPIEIHIPNEDGELMAGMRASVVVPKLTVEDAVVVPRDALLEGVFQREAMVLSDRKGDLGKAELRVVEIGEARGNRVVITNGLQEGDVLITKGHRNVVDGTLVRVVHDRAKEESARPQEGASAAPPADDPPVGQEKNAAAAAEER